MHYASAALHSQDNRMVSCPKVGNCGCGRMQVEYNKQKKG